jgi:aryl-alcohol dehydrogenase-like predicted oxidoreductase
MHDDERVSESAQKSLLRALGATGLEACAIGFGAGALGDASLSDDEARSLIDTVRESGVNLFDSARSYGESEARLGRALTNDARAIVCTKVGYGVPNVADWTYDAVMGGVDRARALLQRDVIDVVYLHSCPRHVLERGDVVRALDDARRAQKVRVAGYAGDGDALSFAVESGRFGAVLASYSVVDQKNKAVLERAHARGIAVVVKRALGNMAFLPGAGEGGPDRAELARRFQAMALDLGPDPFETLVRFAACAPFVDVTLIGTRQAARVTDALRAFEKGPLDASLLRAITSRFDDVGAAWDAVI